MVTKIQVMKINKFIRLSCVAVVLAAMVVTVACSPEETSGGNPLFIEGLDATYTIQQTDENGNRYTSSGIQDENVKLHLWRVISETNESDTGDIIGGAEREFFLPDAGTYVIRHTVVGYNGGSNSVSEKTVVVETPDPISGNIIQNGRFKDGMDNWNILTISASGAAWNIENEMATITGGGWNQQGLYQAVEVVGGKPYNVDMKVSGPGSTETWFELYLSPTPPVQGTEYTADGIRMQLNTWAGCATSSFEGQLSAVGCGGSGMPVTFAEDGTVYFVLKCGGNVINSISVDNVEMRRLE